MQNNVFRLFISSTFQDISPYRNKLYKDVFSKISDFCAEHKASFHPVDLRWGIGEELQRNNEVMKTCLYEVARCKELSPRPSMLILIRNNYGSTLPPFEIPVDEYDELIDAAERSEQDEIGDEQKAQIRFALEMLKKWYEKDDNNIPSIYVIKKRFGEYLSDSDLWNADQKQFCASIETLLTVSGLIDRWPYEKLVRYLGSATEQEIYHGLLKDADFADQVFAVFIEDFSEPEIPKITALKNRIRAVLKEDHIFILGKNDPEDAFCGFVEKALLSSIEHELSFSASSTPYTEEIDRQERYIDQETRRYVARDHDQRFESSIEAAPGKITVLYGPSGSGKSSIMANYIRRHPTVFVCCDASVTAQSILNLTDYLIQRICDTCGLSKETARLSYENAADILQNTLNKTKQRPLTICIDSIDKIADLDRLRQSLFSISIPNSCRIVVSTALPPEWFDIIDRKNVYEIDRLQAEEAEKMFSTYLTASSRRVSGSQQQLVMQRLTSCLTPIYVVSLASYAKKWRSSESIDPADVPDDTKALLSKCLRYLSGGPSISEELFWRSLAYIASANYGLSDEEIQQILKKDDRIRKESKNEHWDMPNNELPPSIWAMVYCRIMDLLTVYFHDGHMLMKWKHSLMKDVVRDRCTQQELQEIANELADHFLSCPDHLGQAEDRRYFLYPNTRKAQELMPFLSIPDWCDRHDDLLSSVAFCDTAVRSGFVDLLLSILQDRSDKNERQNELFHIIRNELFTIKQHPSDFLSVFCGETDRTFDIKDCCLPAAIATFDRSNASENEICPLYYDQIEHVYISTDGNRYAVLWNHRILIYDSRKRCYENAVFQLPAETVCEIVLTDTALYLMTESVLYAAKIVNDRFVIFDKIALPYPYDCLCADPSGSKLILYCVSPARAKQGCLLYDTLSGTYTIFPYPFSGRGGSKYLDIAWCGNIRFSMSYDKKIYIYETSGNELSRQKKAIKTEGQHFRVPYSFHADNNSFCFCYSSMYKYHSGKKRKKAEYYYPFANTLKTYSCAEYSVAVQDHSAAELIEHKSGAVRKIPAAGKIADIIWHYDRASFTVVYYNSRLQVFHLSRLLAQEPVMTMPDYMPSTSSLQTYLNAMGKKRYLPSELIIDWAERKAKQPVDIALSTDLSAALQKDELYVPTSAAISVDGLCALYYHEISHFRMIWAKTAEVLFDFETQKTKDFHSIRQCFSPSGKFYALYLGHTLRICDIPARQWACIKEFSSRSRLTDLYLSDDRCRLLFSDGTLSYVRTADGATESVSLSGVRGTVSCARNAVFVHSMSDEKALPVGETIVDLSLFSAPKYLAIDKETGDTIVFSDQIMELFDRNRKKRADIIPDQELLSALRDLQQDDPHDGNDVRSFSMKGYMDALFVAVPELKLLLLLSRCGDSRYQICRHILFEGSILDLNISQDGTIHVVINEEPFIKRYRYKNEIRPCEAIQEMTDRDHTSL